MNHVAEWKTPELVIHGGKGEPISRLRTKLDSTDYRLVDGQGIGELSDARVALANVQLHSPLSKCS